MSHHVPTLPPRGLSGRTDAPASAERGAPGAPLSASVASPAVQPGLAPPAPGGWRDRIRSRVAHHRRLAPNLREVSVGRGPAFLDGFLLLLAVCAMTLPTTAGYFLATSAAKSVVGLPFAVLMFLSPFALMALLPLRLLHLLLAGVFGIHLRLNLLAPLALVCLAIFLFLGPLQIRPAATVAFDIPPIATNM